MFLVDSAEFREVENIVPGDITIFSVLPDTTLASAKANYTFSF